MGALTDGRTMQKAKDGEGVFSSARPSIRQWSCTGSRILSVARTIDDISHVVLPPLPNIVLQLIQPGVAHGCADI
jgi:hypothetical protein